MKLIKLRGLWWRLRFVNQVKWRNIGGDDETLDGLCSPPDFKKRFLQIDKNLKDKNMLVSILHESLHGCFFDLDESVIEEVSEDIGNLLWGLGYRWEKNGQKRNGIPK